MKAKQLPYHIRVSPRAQQVILRICPHKQFEVVIPQGFDPAQVPAIVQERQAWIEQAVRKLAVQGHDLQKPPSVPEKLLLRALDKCYALHTIQNTRTSSSLEEYAPGKLLLAQGTDNSSRTLLLNWLKKHVRPALSRWLCELSTQHKLSYTRLQIRTQHSRWGSCSARGTISINALISFFPRPLANYVLLHELCHTRHLNHSANYWKLLHSIEGQTAQYDAALRTAWKYIPAYLV